MTRVRLLADDLTGALDTAAEFVPLAGEIPVFWPRGGPLPLSGSAGIDSGTRECTDAAATALVGGMLGLLRDADIAFKKIDSLLRGPTIAEIAACVRAGIWRYCVLAPAFPFQGRVTRGARQHVRRADGWSVVSDDLAASLCALGIPARRARPEADLQSGVSVFDAETDADLLRIVAAVRQCADAVLWIGTGGLAQAMTASHALAGIPYAGTRDAGTPGSETPYPGTRDAGTPDSGTRDAGTREAGTRDAGTRDAGTRYAGTPHVGTRDAGKQKLARPVLGIFGSDQAITADQLAACGEHWLEIEAEAGDGVARRLDEAGMALLSFRLPPATARPAAAERIAAGIARLIDQIAPPGSVVVAGGETLRSLCDAAGATSLLVQGRLVPGVPRSMMQGGRWHGVTVVSKSGAFGHPSLLRELILERTDP